MASGEKEAHFERKPWQDVCTVANFLKTYAMEADGSGHSVAYEDFDHGESNF